MSDRKKECPDCLGAGETPGGDECERCNGRGEIDDDENDPNEEVWQT